MCSPAVCDRCQKITWTGCGQHAEQALAGSRREPLHLPSDPASTRARPEHVTPRRRDADEDCRGGRGRRGHELRRAGRRLAEDAEIVVLERDPYVSYANCGLPYHLGGEIGDRDALLAAYPQSLAASLALDVRTGHEVLAIDPAGRTVTVRELATAGLPRGL